jgi:hypothetical protein
MRPLLTILLSLAAVAQTNTVVIVPAALVSSANALAAAQFDTDGGGELTFLARLVTPPGTNTTHYWCLARFSQTNRVKLNVLTATPPWTNVLVFDYPLTNPTAPFEFLATNGLAVPTQSIF